jgi:hypothetical protein
MGDGERNKDSSFYRRRKMESEALLLARLGSTMAKVNKQLTARIFHTTYIYKKSELDTYYFPDYFLVVAAKSMRLFCLFVH